MAIFDSNVSNGFYIRLTVTEASKDQANNTTTVNWLLQLYSRYAMSHLSDWHAELDGAVVVDVQDSSLSTQNATWVNLASGSLVISHKDDGTKTLPLSGYFRVNNVASYTPQETLNINASMVLVSIDRGVCKIIDSGVWKNSRLHILHYGAWVPLKGLFILNNGVWTRSKT